MRYSLESFVSHIFFMRFFPEHDENVPEQDQFFPGRVNFFRESIKISRMIPEFSRERLKICRDKSETSSEVVGDRILKCCLFRHWRFGVRLQIIL